MLTKKKCPKIIQIGTQASKPLYFGIKQNICQNRRVKTIQKRFRIVKINVKSRLKSGELASKITCKPENDIYTSKIVLKKQYYNMKEKLLLPICHNSFSITASKT